MAAVAQCDRCNHQTPMPEPAQHPYHFILPPNWAAIRDLPHPTRRHVTLCPTCVRGFVEWLTDKPATGAST